MFYSLAGWATVLFPFLGCRNDPKRLYVLSRPRSLGSILDSATIRSIGLAYQKEFPTENNKIGLANKILKDSLGMPLREDSSAIHANIDKNISEDFERGRIVIVNGWILSQTEARQCALFDMNQN